MLAGALFLHEALYVCRDGGQYLKRCFVPTFGLQLGPRLHAAIHLALIAACLALVVWPRCAWLYVLCLVLVTLVIASYSLRVSNHLILAWFMLLTLVLALVVEGGAPPPRLEVSGFVAAGIRGLVVLTYAFAFLHKLNRDYFSLERSSASQLTEFFCWDRGLRDRRLVRALALVGIYGTLLMEAAVPLLLLSSRTTRLGILAGLGFHFSLALLGIVNFSSMMYAGLVAFAGEGAATAAAGHVGALGWPAIVAACIPFLVAVWLVTPRHAARYCPYRFRWAAWPLQWLFGALTAVFVLGAVMLPAPAASGPTLAVGRLGGAQVVLLIGIWSAFALNGLGPYLGWKTEFSFAMFSNLRCDPWRHLLFRAHWRPLYRSPYVRIERVEGLPDAASLEGDSCALLAHHLLSQPEVYGYSPYFLREAVKVLSRFSGTGVRVSCRRDGDHRYEIGSRNGAALPPAPRCLPVNIYPFVSPLDPDLPHSEQGTVLRRDRQLF
jgi:hypothetical protein